MGPSLRGASLLSDTDVRCLRSSLDSVTEDWLVFMPKMVGNYVSAT